MLNYFGVLQCEVIVGVTLLSHGVCYIVKYSVMLCKLWRVLQC